MPHPAPHIPARLRPLYALVRVLARGWHGSRAITPCPLPVSGGALLTATHRSSVDPLLLQAAYPRMLHWMIAREYFELKLFGWVYRLTGSVPVNRTGQDTAATRQALRLLHDGEVVALFPWGRIQTSPDEVIELKDGAAMLALAARVPVVVARITGIRHRSVLWDWLRPHRGVRVDFVTVDLSDLFPRRRDRDTLAQATARITSAMSTPSPA